MAIAVRGRAGTANLLGETDSPLRDGLIGPHHAVKQGPCSASPTVGNDRRFAQALVLSPPP
jgi:hypothetical protein